MDSNLNKLIKNNKNLYFILFLIYIAIFIYFDPPFGLMDDFKNLEHINSLNQNFFQYYFEYNHERTFEKGLFQPFYLLQMYFQYFTTVPIFVYIQNLLIVFLSHYLFIKGLQNFISINTPLAFLFFLSYPYTNDLLIHPSLQEKYSFLLVGISLIYIKKLNVNRYILFLIALTVPLIKLQGTIFLFLYLAIHLKLKNINSQYALLGISTGILLQTYVTFFIDAEYKIRSNLDNILSNLSNPVNLLFLLITVSYLLLKFNENRRNFIELSLALCALSLIFIYINFYILGYLLSTYSYFVSIFLSSLIIYFLKNFRLIYNSKIFIILIMVFISTLLFLLPRLQRWSDLGEIYSTLETDVYGEIYYCSEEATIYLNKIIKSENELIYLYSDSKLNEIRDYIMITDKFQCETFGETLMSNCKNQIIFQTKYSNVLIQKRQCS